MQFSTLFASVLAGAAAVSASPLKTPMVPRSCQVQPPRGLGYPYNFDISKTISPPSERTNSIAFNLPENAPGPCSLVARFPAGFPIYQSGASSVNVFATDGPAAGSLVGTITFQSDPRYETVRTINSFACRPNMGFELKIASQERDGAVSFQQVAGAGLFMEYGC